MAGLAEAQAAASAERDALRQELDHAAIADPDAGRICLGADSVRRLVPHDPPPEALAAPCPPPVALPVRAMTQAEVETAWRVDRMALADCGERLDLLAQWSRAR